MIEYITRDIAGAFRSLAFFFVGVGFVLALLLGGIGYGIYLLCEHLSFVWH